MRLERDPKLKLAKVYMVMVNFQVQYRPRNMHRRGGRKDWGGVSGYVGKERGLGEGKRERRNVEGGGGGTQTHLIERLEKEEDE